MHQKLNEAKNKLNKIIKQQLKTDGCVILPPMDANRSTSLLYAIGYRCTVTMLDPWYNNGYGGVISDYDQQIINIVSSAGLFSDHVFIWGFPEILSRFIGKFPITMSLTAWLTWYYKNNPSVIRGWRSSQMACLHMSAPGSRLYPEHFLNTQQREMFKEGKLRYIPGPTSVIESPLLVGFIGKNEKTNHPTQKPIAVYEPLFRMTTKSGCHVFDPMAGSGTSGTFAASMKLFVILCDISEDYTCIMEQRLGIKRLRVKTLIRQIMGNSINVTH